MWQRTTSGEGGSGYVLQDSVGCLLQGKVYMDMDIHVTAKRNYKKYRVFLVCSTKTIKHCQVSD